jgi:hypothetical protein
MAWYAKYDGVDGSPMADGLTATFLFGERPMDSLEFTPTELKADPPDPDLEPYGGGGATGNVQFQDFHFTKRCDSHSQNDNGQLLAEVHDVGLEGGWYIPLLA